MAMEDVPPTHPRYLSLRTRNLIVAGVERGVTSVHGLIAHGRGEAFDYLLGERTGAWAARAMDTAAAMLLLAERPVISVNGNACALCAGDLVNLGRTTGAKLEVNIFHTSPEREQAIKAMLSEAGAEEVLMPSQTHALAGIDHNRRWVHPEGIHVADVVMVPLEDGDRCRALVENGKRVITVDLNPLSRTSRTAQVTIVDNIVRCLPALVKRATALKLRPPEDLRVLVDHWDNAAALQHAEEAIRGGA
jgi:4-phosphopantoate--beta-alanine ligase